MPRIQRNLCVIRSGVSVALLILSLFVCTDARGQAAPKIRVLIAPCVNKSQPNVVNFAADATDVLCKYLADKGRKLYVVVEKQEAQEAARKMGLIPSVQSDYLAKLSRDDLIRLAVSLHADAIVESEVCVVPPKQREPTRVAFLLRYFDLSVQEYLNGGLDGEDGRNGLDIVKHTVAKGVRQFMQRRFVTTTVVQVQGDKIVLNCGFHQGVEPRDKFIIVREVNGQRQTLGTISVVRAYKEDSEGEVLEQKTPFRASDMALRLYRLPYDDTSHIAR